MSGIVVTGKGVDLYRMIVLLHGMKLEEKGFKRSRGPTCYSVVKREFNLKGSRPKVIEEFSKIIEEFRSQVEPSEIKKF